MKMFVIMVENCSYVYVFVKIKFQMFLLMSTELKIQHHPLPTSI